MALVDQEIRNALEFVFNDGWRTIAPADNKEAHGWHLSLDKNSVTLSKKLHCRNFSGENPTAWWFPVTFEEIIANPHSESQLEFLIKYLSHFTGAIPHGHDVRYTTVEPHDIARLRAMPLYHDSQYYFDDLQGIHALGEEKERRRRQQHDGFTPHRLVNPLQIPGITFSFGARTQHAAYLGETASSHYPGWYDVDAVVRLDRTLFDEKKVKHINQVATAMKKLGGRVQVSVAASDREKHIRVDLGNIPKFEALRIFEEVTGKKINQFHHAERRSPDGSMGDFLSAHGVNTSSLPAVEGYPIDEWLAPVKTGYVKLSQKPANKTHDGDGHLKPQPPGYEIKVSGMENLLDSKLVDNLVSKLSPLQASR